MLVILRKFQTWWAKESLRSIGTRLRCIGHCKQNRHHLNSGLPTCVLFCIFSGHAGDWNNNVHFSCSRCISKIKVLEEKKNNENPQNELIYAILHLSSCVLGPISFVLSKKFLDIFPLAIFRWMGGREDFWTSRRAKITNSNEQRWALKRLHYI